ncbi:hypothetical protein BD769DRAFT_1393223 [Suillus cothurnatus]|nr:hypothetical protein BD769DRAFT_1393223 [Suillus cothurnatus]
MAALRGAAWQGAAFIALLLCTYQIHDRLMRGIMSNIWEYIIPKLLSAIRPPCCEFGLKLRNSAIATVRSHVGLNYRIAPSLSGPTQLAPSLRHAIRSHIGAVPACIELWIFLHARGLYFHWEEYRYYCVHLHQTRDQSDPQIFGVSAAVYGYLEVQVVDRKTHSPAYI